MPHYRQQYLWILVLLFASQHAYSQKAAILNVQKALDSLRNHLTLEKTYLQTDKDQYLLGDTLWYKAYVLDGSFATPSLISGVVYIELADATGNLIRQARQNLIAGSIFGDFFLDPTLIKPGKFRLRAYTRWLQNFGNAYLSEQIITITGDTQQEWSVNLAPPEIVDAAEKKSVHLQMNIRNLDTKPFRMKPVVFEAHEKGKRLFNETFIVDTSGSIAVNFDLSKKQHLYNTEIILREEERIKARFSLGEILPKRQYDVQFLPESGHWLSGIPSTMGIKVIDESGAGIQASGLILNASRKEVTSFNTTYKGMGTCALPPLPLGNYTAVITFEDGTRQEYNLPAPVAEGVALHYHFAEATDTIHLQLNTSPAHQDESFLLIGQVRGVMCYGAIVQPSNGIFQIKVPRIYFPEGIVHFSISTLAGTALAERMVYNQQDKQGLEMGIESHREHYGTRDSVALKITVKDSLGNGVVSNLSMAVTDDSQYQSTRWGTNIRSHYYLEAELQGTVEDPNYYFSGSKGSQEALDNLLLTQGWLRYDQSLLQKTKAIKYPSEPFFSIRGAVENAFGKGIRQRQVILLSTGKTTLFADTLTDENGRFMFQHFPLFDTAGFVIQARNKKGKSFNVGIQLAPDTEPVSWQANPYLAKAATWYINVDSNLQKRLEDQRTYQRNLNILRHQADPNMIMLDEVTVTSRKVIKASKNLNGPGEADQLLGEEELIASGQKTLLQILQEKIKGFHVGYYPRKNGQLEFMVLEKKARLIFDGVDLEFFYDNEVAISPNDHMQFLKSYLERYAGEDVLGVEIMYNPRYNNRYNARFLTSAELINASPVMGTDPVYIEITTRNGSGPFMHKTPGVVHFRPMPFTFPRDFYRPRYPNKTNLAELKDLRSTIHWEPMVITNENGEATVSFYTSDRTGSYTIRVEGCDDNGNLAVKKQQLIIK